MVVDHLAARCGVDWQHRADVQGQVVRVVLGGREVLLAKPQTYMNRSGQTAAALCAQWEVPPEDVLVIFDDFLLDLGRLRFRRGGSDGGHNGLASGTRSTQHGGCTAPTPRIASHPQARTSSTTS